MAENMTSHRRKPQSLNDRNNRLLQDLSAPPKQPPSSHGEDEETKKSIFKLAGRRRLCKAASPTEDVANEDDDPDLADFDSPVIGDTSLERAGTENKFTPRDETKEANTELADEPSFSIITDFVSPSPQEKQKQEKQHDGGKNEIMDILDDLTSKLGTMLRRQLYEAFLNSEIVLSAFDGPPLAALTILKKICDHPLLLTKRAAEDVLEGMKSTLTPEEAGVAERLAMHIADNVETDDFQTKNDSISCKLSFNISPIDAKELTESEIKARIRRLSTLFENKSTVSRLPDGGAKIQKLIIELTRELKDLKAAKRIDMPQAIDLEDISNKMHKGLNL